MSVASRHRVKLLTCPLIALIVLGNPRIGGANDEFVAACRNFGASEVVFLGRAQPAVMRRVSAEKEIEQARHKMVEAKAAFEALYDPETADPPLTGKVLELSNLFTQASVDLNSLIARYPQQDLVVVPFDIERSFRGAVGSRRLRLRENGR